MNYEKVLNKPLEVQCSEWITFYKGEEFISESHKDNTLNFLIEKVLGLDYPNKFLVTINHQVVCFANSRNKAKDVINYAYTKDPTVLKDKKIKKRVDLILNRNNKEELHDKLKNI